MRLNNLIILILIASTGFPSMSNALVFYEKKQNLTGFGGIYNSKLLIEEKVVESIIEEDKSKKKEVIKVYKTWVRGCGDVELLPPSDPTQFKQGDPIRVRLQGGRSCIVSDWERF